MENEKKIIFATTIAPKHILENRQSECVNSWAKFGKVLSFNHPEEIEKIKNSGQDYACVEFIPTHGTQNAMLGRHYVSLNEFLIYSMSQNETIIIINSDIYLHDGATLGKLYEYAKQNQNTFCYLHRFNHNGKSTMLASIYKDGIDCFIITPQAARNLPLTMFCLGQCFFDLWIPFHLLSLGYKLASVHNVPIIYHQNHEQQHNGMQWAWMGKYTGFLIGKLAYGKASDVSGFLYKQILPNTENLIL